MMWIAATLLVLFAGARARGAVAKIELPNSSLSFAIDPDTGMVAAAEPANDIVRFYPKIGSDQVADGAVGVKVSKGPLSVVHKKFGKDSFFLVLCDAGQEEVIDAKTLKVLKAITLTGSSPFNQLVSENPEDPYVYVLMRHRDSNDQNSGVRVVDLRVQKDIGSVPLWGGLGGATADGAFSPDGHKAYTTSAGMTPSGLSVVSVAWSDIGKLPQTSQVYFQNASITGYVPDPFGQTVATGTGIYSADMKTNLQVLPGSTVCFLPNRPLLVAISGRRARGGGGFIERETAPETLIMISTNSYHTVGEATVEGKPPEAGPVGGSIIDLSGGSFFYKQQFLADSKNDMLIVCDEHKFQVVPIADFDPPKEPFLFATVEGRRQLAVGKAATLSVKAMDSSAKLELVDAPKGMALQGNTLSWTPGDGDVGEVSASIRLSKGELEKRQDLTLRVSREAITLPFIPDTLDVSADGSTAVVATAPRVEPYNRDTGPKESRIAIVDLKTGKVLTDRTLLTAVASVRLDEKHVYTTMRDSDAFYVLSREGLSDEKRIFTNGKTTAVYPVGNRVAAVSEMGAVAVYDTTDFSVVHSPASNSGMAKDPNRIFRVPVQVQQTPDGLEINGIYMDRTLEKVLAIARTDQLKAIAPMGETLPQTQSRSLPAEVSRWGVAVDFDGTIKRANGDVAGQFGSHAATVLGDRPMVASVLMEEHAAGGGGLMQARLVRGSIAFRDLLSGTVQESLHVFDQPVTQASNGPLNGAPPQTACARDGKVMMLAGDQLFIVEAPHEDSMKFPEPLQIPGDQGAVVLSSNKPTTVRFRTTGGSGPVEYSLAHEIEGLDLAKDGTLTVKPGMWMEQAIGALAIAARNGVLTQNRIANMSNTIDLEDYRKTTGAVFLGLTGHEAAGIPAAVSITVLARDQNQQTTSADRVLLLDVPADQVEAKMKEILATVPPLGSQTLPQRAGRGTPSGGQDQAARVDALEKRVDALEAKIDLLTKLLSEKNK